MAYLRFILAACIGVIAGLVAYGLVETYQLVIGICVGAAAFGAILFASHFFMRPDDRDPTIRPSSVPKKR